MEKFDKRNILKDKLHQKIAEARIRSNPIGPNAERKIQKDIDAEKKLVDNVAIFNNIEQNIIITFQQLKKNEI